MQIRKFQSNISTSRFAKTTSFDTLSYSSPATKSSVKSETKTKRLHSRQHWHFYVGRAGKFSASTHPEKRTGRTVDARPLWRHKVQWRMKRLFRIKHDVSALHRVNMKVLHTVNVWIRMHKGIMRGV